jgi:PAS domain S-box-containing protein
MGKNFQGSDVPHTDYFQGGGEMGELIRRFDWSKTPLGAVETWQDSLKIAVRNMLNSRFPMFIWWGDSLINIYNDGYAPILAKKHSDALGQPAGEIWGEIWSDLESQVQSVINDGIASWNEEVLLLLKRSGFAEETYFTWSYSPLTDDAGKIGGLFCACTEDTAKVLSRRRMQTLHAVSDKANQAAAPVEACQIAAKILEENPCDIAFALIYTIETADETRADLCATTNIAAGTNASPYRININENDLWNFSQVGETGEIQVLDNIQAKFGKLPGGAWTDAPVQAAVLPIKKAGGGGGEMPNGFLVAGISPCLALDEEYRSFLELTAAQIATAISNAQAYQAEKKRTAALAELDRAKTELFSNVSHEFRTPLTLMLDNLEEVLNADGQLSENEREQIETAHRNSLRLLKLLNDLPDFTSLEKDANGYLFEPFAAKELPTQIELNLNLTRLHLENNKRLNDILENLNDGFVALDRDFRITYVNRQGEILLNREAGDLLGKVFWDEFPTTIGTRFEEIYRRAMSEGISSSVIDFYADHQRWYEVSSFPTQNGITIFFRNITESHQAAESLRESEERFRNMADHAPVMVWVTEPDGYCSYLSQSWYEFTGQTPANGLSFGWINATHPDDRQLAHDTFVAANEKREFFQVEYRLRRYDGVYRWAIDSAQPRFGENGKYLGYIGSVMDITERKEAEEKLRDSEMRYRTLFNSIDEGFYISQIFFDEATGKPFDYLFLEVNPSFEKLTGIKNAEGRLISELVPNLEPEWFEIYGKVARTGEPARFENGSEELDGRVFDVYAFRIGEPHEHKVAVIFNNITERKRSDRERQSLLEREQVLRRQAETANRLKDEFLATVSHELRTPLNAILGWSNMLQSGKATGEIAARANQTIYRNAKSQAQLIEDLLDVSRIISGKLKFEPRPVELAAIVESAIDTLRPTAEAKSIELQTTLADEPFMISGDDQRLQQIVWNLVSNAVKFTPDGGRITVRLERVERNVQLTVTDTGKGIEAKFLPYLFERFRQEDASSTRRHGGLGLGLAIVRHLTELHGGTVSATSAGENQGSTFTLKLPLITVSGNGRKKTADDKGDISREFSTTDLADITTPKQLMGVRLLLVDDEADTLEMLGTALRFEGAEVRLASSAAAAREVFRQWQPDIIVSDIAMPDEDGYSLIAGIRELAPDRGGLTPAVAMTAYVRVEDRIRVLSSGFQMYVPKPAEPQELIDALTNLLGNRKNSQPDFQS